MNLRRYVANDMREALAAIRAELGAEAVMLSSRKVGSSVEVIAAVDYDGSFGGEPDTAADEASARALGAYEQAARRSVAQAAAPQDRAPQQAPTPIRTAPAQAAAAARAAAPAEALVSPPSVDEGAGAAAAAQPSQAAAPAAAADGPTAASLALEIQDLRRLLETQLASLAWSDLNRQAPVRARVLRELAKLGVDAVVAAELAGEVPGSASFQEAMRLVVRRFGERCPS